jgi:hypothetical protein
MRVTDACDLYLAVSGLNLGRYNLSDCYLSRIALIHLHDAGIVPQIRIGRFPSIVPSVRYSLIILQYDATSRTLFTISLRKQINKLIT